MYALHRLLQPTRGSVMRFAVAISLFLVIPASVIARSGRGESSSDPVSIGRDYRGLVEQKHLRSRHAKHYRTASGKFVAEISSEPRHYRAQDGAWKPIELEFRTDAATGYEVAERNTLKVRAGGDGIRVVDGKGRGVRWITRDRPVVDTRPAHGAPGIVTAPAASLAVQDDALTWTYELTPMGLKSCAVVDAPQGLRTYRFPYQILGIDGDFVTDDRGNAILAGVLYVPPPSSLPPMATWLRHKRSIN